MDIITNVIGMQREMVVKLTTFSGPGNAEIYSGQKEGIKAMQELMIKGFGAQNIQDV